MDAGQLPSGVKTALKKSSSCELLCSSLSIDTVAYISQLCAIPLVHQTVFASPRILLRQVVSVSQDGLVCSVSNVLQDSLDQNVKVS